MTASDYLSKHFFLLCILFTALLILSCQEESVKPEGVIKNAKSNIQLQKLTPQETGINFSNRIKENSKLHAFIWNFIYQGAGVAIGDINNDNLPDIYFSGNMVSDKLYLNKGNFKFEDISLSSGIQDKLWSTGVTMVDVNSDGLLDIYVCKNFFLLQKGVRTNKLFINNGDLTFTEQAKDYGLDDAGYSIQSQFFDADNDGDLDMYLVNQPMDQYAAQYAKPETVKKLPFSDKFFINENGKYKDVTYKKNLLNKSYGLSAIASDFNKNGNIDLYLCNDYDNGDKFYMNNGNATFKNEISERIDHSSYYSMGSDAADINNDGLLDFITLDMAFNSHYRSKTNMKSMQPEKFWSLVDEGNYYQYPVNNLHVNNGQGYFSEIAHFLNISHTDWSWSPLFVDLDSDSNNDLLISNGLLRDLRNNDFINTNLQNGKFEVNQSNYQSVLNTIPSTPVANFLYQNNGHLNFKNETNSSGFYEKTFSSGMAYADLDGDGDMDIVINNTNAQASIFKNQSQHKNYINIKLKGSDKNTSAIGATIELFSGDLHQIASTNNARGYMSSSEMITHFGLNNRNRVDSIVINWNNLQSTSIINPAINQKIIVDFKKESKRKRRITTTKTNSSGTLSIPYTHQENQFDDYKKQVLLPHKLSTNGPFITKADFNKDGLVDLFFGGAANQSSELFIQNKKGEFTLSSQPVFKNHRKHEDLMSVAFDLENDGDLDIYVVSGGGEFDEDSKNNIDRIYINNGSGHFSNYKGNLSFTNFDGQCVVTGDFNNDSYEDIFIGGRSKPGEYPNASPSKIVINNAGILSDQSSQWNTSLKSLGMVTDAQARDFDQDGDLDIIVVGEWMAPTILINTDGKFEIKPLISDQNLNGWHWSIDSGDFDSDGDQDLVIGNLGLNNKFKASPKKTFQIFAGDLDDNGDHDVVLAKMFRDKLIPVRGKECSTQEMPFVSEKFKTYDAFARATLIDIYTPEKLSTAFNKTIENFQHLYIENLGGNSFKVDALPHMTQIGTIKDFIVQDFNGDGNLDFLYGGNHYSTEVETVRYDANKGGLCLGDGKGKFTSVALKNSDLYLRGDVRDLEIINIKRQNYVIATVNNDKLITQKIPDSILRK